ncbi:MAG: hypothetical protein K0R19_2517 [Bacillota bacterium]|jgi:hypothetical protein|nr:hypothetical protein [Bacillota bacterium]
MDDYNKENTVTFNEEGSLAIGQKLKISDIIKQIFYVYLAGWKQFLVLSLITMITVLGMAVVQVVLYFSLPVGFILFFLSLLTIYFALRANAGIILLTKDILQGGKRTVKEAYRQSNGYAGHYFSIALMYTLILCLPTIGIWISYEFILNDAVKYGVIGLLLIPLAFLSARYWLAIPSAILIGDSGGLKSSVQLVKGDFWRVLKALSWYVCK